MEGFIDFLINAGRLKDTKRRGAMLYGKKDVESTAEHTFRMVLMAWIFGERKRLDIKKVLKMALVHDLCEVYAGDVTPYDGFLPKDKKERDKFVRTWPVFPHELRKKWYENKYKKEYAGLKKLLSNLPTNLKEEIFRLWLDYEKGLSKEGRFVRQIDRVENLLQAMEYWDKDKKFPTKPWWIHAKEAVDDPLLIEFMEVLDRKFYQKPPKK